MPRRSAFVLIEVMVSVMIVSVVISALLHMQGSTTTKLSNIKEMMKTNQYSSFLLSLGDKYGFDKSQMDMERLVENFDLEDDLRRHLKSMRAELDYKAIKSIDTSEFEDENNDSNEQGANEQNTNIGIVFEIGKTILKTDKFTSHLIRIRVQ